MSESAKRPSLSTHSMVSEPEVIQMNNIAPNVQPTGSISNSSENINKNNPETISESRLSKCLNSFRTYVQRWKEKSFNFITTHWKIISIAILLLLVLCIIYVLTIPSKEVPEKPTHDEYTIYRVHDNKSTLVMDVRERDNIIFNITQDNGSIRINTNFRSKRNLDASLIKQMMNDDVFQEYNRCKKNSNENKCSEHLKKFITKLQSLFTDLRSGMDSSEEIIDAISDVNKSISDVDLSIQGFEKDGSLNLTNLVIVDNTLNSSNTPVQSKVQNTEHKYLSHSNQTAIEINNVSFDDDSSLDIKKISTDKFIVNDNSIENNIMATTADSSEESTESSDEIFKKQSSELKNSFTSVTQAGIGSSEDRISDFHLIQATTLVLNNEPKSTTESSPKFETKPDITEPIIENTTELQNESNTSLVDDITTETTVDKIDKKLQSFPKLPKIVTSVTPKIVFFTPRSVGVYRAKQDFIETNIMTSEENTELSASEITEKDVSMSTSLTLSTELDISRTNIKDKLIDLTNESSHTPEIFLSDQADETTMETITENDADPILNGVYLGKYYENCDGKDECDDKQRTVANQDSILSKEQSMKRFDANPFSPAESLKTNQQIMFTPNMDWFPKPVCFYGSPPNAQTPSSRQQSSSGYGSSSSYGYQSYVPNYQYPISYGGYGMYPQQYYPNYNGYMPYYPNVPNVASGNTQNIVQTAQQQQPYYCTFLPSPTIQFPVIPGNSDFRKILGHSSIDSSKRSQSDNLNMLDDVNNDINEMERRIERIESSLPCPDNQKSCLDGSKCIPVENWCDGTVNCLDISDEMACSCKFRVDKGRLCDGYFDCPNGEDELGCFGCSETAFSCDDWSRRQRKSTCVSLSQRCDGIRNCPNGKDELDCSLLTENISTRQTFKVSQAIGFLHRNFQGKWYPSCINNEMWASDACIGEVGHLKLKPLIQLIENFGSYSGLFITSTEFGTVKLIDACPKGIAFVTCPNIECGTRVLNEDFIRSVNENSEESELLRYRRNIVSSLYDTLVANDTLNSETNRQKRGETRVVGGRSSKPAAWPWVVALYRDGIFHCGGVLVNNQWIVTAAHCADKYWQHYYEVQAGMLRRFSFSPMEQIKTISHVLVYSKYNRANMNNDLALMRLHAPVSFNRWVRPICLPSKIIAGDNWIRGPEAGTICTAVGWGATIEHGPDPDHIREVEVPILARCKHSEDEDGEEICAGEKLGGKDACQGDSGGPLLCRNPNVKDQWYLAGIVSHGEGCARPDEPGAYTRVSLYINWIAESIFNDNLSENIPLQRCPGMECHSSGGKCVSRRKRCDRIIDCLLSEDEIGCSDDDLFPSLIRQTFDSILLSRNQINDTFVGASNRANSENKAKEIIEFLMMQTKSPLNSSEINEIQSYLKSHNDKINISNDLSNIGIHSDSTSVPQNISEVNTASITIKSKNSIPNILSVSNFEFSENSASMTPSSMLATNNATIPDVNTNVESNDATSRISLHSTSGISNNSTSTISLLSSDDIVTTNKNTEVSETTPIISKDLHETSSTTTIINMETKIPLSNIKKDENSETAKTETTETFFSTGTNNSTLDNNIEENTSVTKLNQITTSQQFQFSTEKTMIEHKWPDDLEPPPESESVAPIRIERNKRVFFMCSKIKQTISIELYCNGEIDCEDGSDEAFCTCRDKLERLDKNAICDGFMDCSDETDEEDCYVCPKNYFQCSKSRSCVPLKKRCDGRKYDCGKKEDETNCLALTSGFSINLDIDGQPQLNMEGIISVNKNNEWLPFCGQNWNDSFAARKAQELCHYLGFNGFDTYFNILVDEQPLHIIDFDNRNKSISELNRTGIKKCDALYIKCLHGITTQITSHKITSFSTDEDLYIWSWNGAIHINGTFVCTSTLVDYSWIITDSSCVENVSLIRDFITVLFGSKNVEVEISGAHEQIINVDYKYSLTNITILHLERPIVFSRYVKPINFIKSQNEILKKEKCVAVGIDSKLFLRTVFLMSVTSHCEFGKRCFKRISDSLNCNETSVSWKGTIVCLSSSGWYPAAVYQEKAGQCGFKTSSPRTSISFSLSSILEGMNRELDPQKATCEGMLCPLGNCLDINKICNGIQDCHDGSDESIKSCIKRNEICHNSTKCECSKTELRCSNEICIPKEKFCDGVNDCGDWSDEPIDCSCSDYLRMSSPKLICDGHLNCLDKSDENPSECGCNNTNLFRCNSQDKCIPFEFVCDNKHDCPEGEDENQCVALIGENEPGIGELIQRSYGVWHSKCYQDDKKFTQTELEKICERVGFSSGRASIVDKVLKNLPKIPIINGFQVIRLNSQQKIIFKNSRPMISFKQNNTKECKRFVIQCT